MSVAAEALRAARAAGVTVTSDGQHLSLVAPAEPPAEVLDLLRQHKSALVELLQHDAGAWADAVATRLDPDRPPTDVPPSRWTQFIVDCRSFVEGEWAEKAAALKWDGRQLFGCHCDRPSILQWWGALWLVNGGEIVAMSADVIRIKTTRGTQQSIRKMDHPYNFVAPVWELC